MSITLLASVIEAITVGGVATETDDAAAVTDMRVDWMGNTLTWTVQLGKMVSGAFVPGSRSRKITMYVDMNSGNWYASTGQSGNYNPSGTVALFKSVRNSLETTAAAVGAAPGTQVAWP